MTTRTIPSPSSSPDIETIPGGGVLDVPGYRAHGVACGLKKKRRDLAVIHSTVPDTACAGVFTTNRVQAAPVLVSKRVVAKGRAQAIVVNSGCANACTGGQGLLDAEHMAAFTGKLLGAPADRVLVCSTGVIGQHLLMDKVEDGLKRVVGALDAREPGAVAEAIMTTDSGPKECLVRFRANGRTYHLGAVGKGAGMIHPQMATMLAFLVTDAPVAPTHLQGAVSRVADATFNMITVDGDTSTNDSVLALANGAGGGDALEPGTPAFDAFETALGHVCRTLSLAIVADGEGATRVMEVTVTGAASVQDARTVARAVTRSPLVKTALHGKDPNWGRVLAAAGASGAVFDATRVTLTLGNRTARARLVKDGAACETLDEAALSALMDARVVTFHLDLGAGDAQATAWGCDLTKDYVTINADYTT